MAYSTHKAMVSLRFVLIVVRSYLGEVLPWCVHALIVHYTIKLLNNSKPDIIIPPCAI